MEVKTLLLPIVALLSIAGSTQLLRAYDGCTNRYNKCICSNTGWKGTCQFGKIIYGLYPGGTLSDKDTLYCHCNSSPNLLRS